MEALLKGGNTVQFKPTGNSMYPLIHQERDEVIVTPVAKFEQIRVGDVAVFRRENGILVIHRVCKIRDGAYYFVGDNQSEVEGPINKEQILGIMTGFVRRGKKFSVTNIVYRLYSKGILLLRPIRPILSKLFHYFLR